MRCVLKYLSQLTYCRFLHVQLQNKPKLPGGEMHYIGHGSEINNTYLITRLSDVLKHSAYFSGNCIVCIRLHIKEIDFSKEWHGRGLSCEYHHVCPNCSI